MYHISFGEFSIGYTNMILSHGLIGSNPNQHTQSIYSTLAHKPSLEFNISTCAS